MVYILALGAALSNALTSILQRYVVEDAPASDQLRLRLLTRAMRRPVWLAGFGFMIVSFVLQATALHVGQLSEVQPTLTTELLFLVVILSVWFDFALGWREWLGSAAAALGLAGFLVFAAPAPGTVHPADVVWGRVGGACAVVVAAAILLTRRGPRWWRAAMFGVAGAVAYSFTAACTKEVSVFVTTDWVSMFWHWQTYSLAVCGAGGVFLAQNAYNAGPIAASQSTLILVDPLASILIGIGLFDEDLRTSGVYGPLEALSLLLLFSGGLVLSNSPLITGIRRGESGEYEKLRHRFRGGLHPLRALHASLRPANAVRSGGAVGSADVVRSADARCGDVSALEPADVARRGAQGTERNSRSGPQGRSDGRGDGHGVHRGVDPPAGGEDAENG
jgi:drug/metabolite transporter (DMT)-like permease